MATDEMVVIALAGIVVGVDVLTGEKLWENRLPGGGYGPVAIEVTSRYVFASADGARLFCLERAGGSQLWSERTKNSGRATLLGTSDEIICIKGGDAECFEFNGTRRWHLEVTSFSQASASLGIPGRVVQADKSA